MRLRGKIVTKRGPLFPGYLFVAFDPPEPARAARRRQPIDTPLRDV